MSEAKRRGRPPARPAEHEPGARSGVQLNLRTSDDLRAALDDYVAKFNKENQISTHRNVHAEKALKLMLASAGFWDMKADKRIPANSGSGK